MCLPELLENPWCLGAKDFSFLPYLVGQDCVDLLQQLLLRIRVQGQLVGHVTQAVAGGLIPSKDKDECLGQDLCVGQGCGEMSRSSVKIWLMVSARTRQQQVLLRQVCCSCFLIMLL